MADVMVYRLTRPVTAYEVLERVCDLIQEDHRRLRMHLLFFYPYKGDDAPSCRTTACLASWIEYVIRPKAPRKNFIWVISRLDHTAFLIFPRNSAARKRLRRGFTTGRHFILPDGTEEQANKAVLFLQTLMRDYKRDLRATTIAPLP